MDQDERIVSQKQIEEVDEELERSLRPQNLAEVIGRDKEKKALKVMIEASKGRGDAVDHILFHGPPGLGKTSLSLVIAKEMGVPIYTTSGPAIERQGDLAAILTNIEPNGILFIDEIHRLHKTIEEILYPAMEDRAIDIIIGKGPSAKTLRLDLNKFTVIGATTRVSLLSAPLRDRFGVDFRLDYYTHEEITELINKKADILNVKIDLESASMISRRARRTPRLAERLLKRVRDFSQVHNNSIINTDITNKTLEMLEIDEIGLDYLDRKILSTLISNFKGGPVGLSTLAASVNEDVSTIEDVYEPYLLREGFLVRSPRGRLVTDKAYQHLGL